MRTPHRLLFVIAIALLALAPMVQAQTTTGNIAGTVSASGEALPGVTVEAVHVPTGTRYDTVSGANGRYTIPTSALAARTAFRPIWKDSGRLR